MMTGTAGEIKKPVSVTAASVSTQLALTCYVTVNLTTLVAWPSNGRRIEVEPCSCNRRISQAAVPLRSADGRAVQTYVLIA